MGNTNVNECNPKYTTLWAVVMPYNKTYRDDTGNKAWVRIFSVESTARTMLDKVKKLALVQGEGEPFMADAELVDWTLPREIEAKNVQIVVKLKSGVLEPIELSEKDLHCEKYVSLYLNGPKIPHIEHEYGTDKLLLKFSVPIPDDATSTGDLLRACMYTQRQILHRFKKDAKFVDTKTIIAQSNDAVNSANPLIVVDPDGSGVFIFASEQDKNDWIDIDEYGIFRKEAVNG